MKSFNVTLVELRIHLASTFDQIQRRHRGVCQALTRIQSISSYYF